MADRVREPIQVYLTSAERERLDRLASAFGISRSEVLRRGLTELDVETPPRVLRALADSGLAVGLPLYPLPP